MRILPLLILLTATAGAGDTITIYPREFATVVEERRVVGNGGELVLVEDAEGEEIEVVEFRPSRASQRQDEVLLFSTAPGKDNKPKTLQRQYQRWVNGQWAETEVAVPAEPDRAIYRRGSNAWEKAALESLEAAELNAELGRLQWFLQLAAEAELLSQDEPLSAALPALVAYEKASAWLRQRHQDSLQHQLLVRIIDDLRGDRQALANRQQELDQATSKLTEMTGKLATLQAEAGTGPMDKLDPRRLPLDRLKVDHYEAGAEVAFLTHAVQDGQARLQRGLAAVTAAVGAEATTAEVDAATLAKWRNQLLASDPAALLANLPTVASLLQLAAERLSALIAEPPTAASEAQTQLLEQVRASYGDTTPSAALDKVLAAFERAAAQLQTVTYGRYRVTLLMQHEGIENCLGTPITLRVGDITRVFYANEFADSERFHEIAFDIEIREPEDVMLTYNHPNDAGSMWGYVPDFNDYNRRRLRGWDFRQPDFHGRLLAKALATEKSSLQQVLETHSAVSFNNAGVINLSLSVGPASRRNHRGSSAPDASIDAILLDTITLARVAEPPVVVRQVLAQKNWLKPGEGSAFMAWLHNRTASPQTAKLTATWISGIGTREQIGEREVTVGANSFQRVVFDWTSPAAAPSWGQACEIRAITGDAESAAEDVFAIHPNTFAVMVHGGGVGDNVYHGPKNYDNHHEIFGITFCDSVYMLPDDVLTPFIPGMTSSPINHILMTRAEAQHNNRVGVATMQYLSPLTTGQKSYEMYLKYPEWFPSRLLFTEDMNNNHLAVERGMAELYAEGKPIDAKALTDEYPLLHIEQPVNHGDRLLFDRLVADLIEYHYLIDYDGTRWDGGPITIFSTDFLGRQFVNPETGEPVVTLEQRKQLAAERLHELKQRMWEHHPDWVYGNNGDSFGYGATLLNFEQEPPDVADYPHFTEFMKDHGSYMDEGWMSAHHFPDDRNKVERYLRICFKQAHGMKRAGGYLQTFSPDRDGAPHYTVDCLYFTLLPHLAGATYYGKLAAMPGSEDGPIHFITRFSEFFLDEQLRPLPDAEDRVAVDLPDVWSWEVATIRRFNDDHVRVVVPIVQKHPRERLYATQNRFSELPERVTDPFEVSIEAPEGFTDVEPQVWELTCTPRTQARRLEADFDGSVVVELSDLNIFTVVVADFER